MRLPGTWLAVLMLLVAGGCRCRSADTVSLEAARLVVNPTRLTLPSAFIGVDTSDRVTVDNLGGQATTVAVTISAPFRVDVDSVSLGAGETQRVVVTWTPAAPGLLQGLLTIGDLEIPVSAVGLAVPECTTSSVCADAHFDFQLAQCVTAAKPEGTPCENSCVVQGSCAAGECVGAFRTCDDQNACTVDACSEAGGCSHSDVTCPAATDACHVSSCDAQLGCLQTEVVDGTLCGPDDCRATEVNVCLLGQCVTRRRPPQGRCANTWVPAVVPGRYNAGLVYDSSRQRVVLFGGTAPPKNDTWEWDGASWLLRTPATSPPATSQPAMAYDSRRHRTVMFTGRTGETWEWDGVTWTPRSLMNPSPGHTEVSVLAYDSVRRVTVLMNFSAGGANPSGFETWQWNGFAWTQRPTASAPPVDVGWPRFAAFDEARGRVVLRFNLQTWEWDGTHWINMTPMAATSAGPPEPGPLAYDADRQRVTAIGNNRATKGLWEWNGLEWTRVSDGPADLELSVQTRMTYDSARRQLVAFGGTVPGTQLTSESGTFLFSQRTWTTDSINKSPALNAMTFSPRDGRVLGYCRHPYFCDPAEFASVYAWNGARWTTLHANLGPTSPDRLVVCAQQRPGLMLFDSNSQTWLWEDVPPTSGAPWSLQTTAHSPSPRTEVAVAYDSFRGKVVLFGGRSSGGDLLTDTWEWNGTDWTDLGLPAGPAIIVPRLVFDSSRRSMMLIGGLPTSGVGTWSLSASGWTFVATLPQVVLQLGVVAFDEQRQRIVMFGEGSAGTAVTSEFDGTTWQTLQPTVSPPPPFPSWTAMAWDGARHRTVLSSRGETWLFLP